MDIVGDETKYVVRSSPQMWCCEPFTEPPPKHKGWDVVIGAEELIRSLLRWMAGE